MFNFGLKVVKSKSEEAAHKERKPWYGIVGRCGHPLCRVTFTKLTPAYPVRGGGFVCEEHKEDY